jgi:hypothetical protein
MIVLTNVPRISLFPQFGWIPDPADSAGKDLLLGSTPMAAGSMGTVQDEMDLSPFFRPVSNQMQLPSCTANSTADVWEALSVMRKVDGGMPLQAAVDSTPDLSRMFLWWCGRNEMSPNRALDAAAGCHQRLIMDVLARHGVPEESLWPYDCDAVGPNGELRPVVRPSIKAFRAAIVNASAAFYCIADTGEDRHNLLLQALGARHPPVFGTALVSSFLSYRSGVIPAPNLTNSFIGRHSMALVGWSAARNAYKVRNSWSEGWGEGGYCWMSKDYLLSGHTASIWVATQEVL